MYTTMRAPNIAIFIVTVILAFVGVWEYVGAPVRIPEIVLPIVGSTKDIPAFLTANAFWLVFLAWVLLAIAALLPHHDKAKAGAGGHAAQPAA
jgi:hypothetical protein